MLRSPLVNPILVSPYGKRMLNGKPDFHIGIDLVDAAGNTEVYAMGPGEVVWDFDSYTEKERWDMNSNSSLGNFVIIKHGELFVRYGHLVKNLVSNGQKVDEKTLIGKYGDVGFSYGAHIHTDMTDIWGKWGKIDPMTQIKL